MTMKELYESVNKLIDEYHKSMKEDTIGMLLIADASTGETFITGIGCRGCTVEMIKSLAKEGHFPHDVKEEEVKH